MQKFGNESSVRIKILFIIACCFAIALFVVIHILNFDREEKALTYNELKAKNMLIESEIVYNFMNQMFFDSDTLITDSLEFTKLMCLSGGHGKEFKEFIRSINDTILLKSEKRYMIDQLSTKRKVWDSEKLKNCWCVSPSDLNKIENSPFFYWDAFKNKFGKYGCHGYSVPIFNESKTFVVIEHALQIDGQKGHGEIIAFIRVNNKWEYYTKILLWIS